MSYPAGRVEDALGEGVETEARLKFLSAVSLRIDALDKLLMVVFS